MNEKCINKIGFIFKNAQINLLNKCVDKPKKKISCYNTNEYKFLNASLLTSIDKVANTASVYGAFLKKFKTSAKHKLELKAIHIQETLNNNKVFNEDINSEVILEQKYDIVYLDPPYNQRQYSSNYHPLNYIAKYDNTIEVYGKTGLLKDSNKSKYCQKKEDLVKKELESILRKFFSLFNICTKEISYSET